MKIYTMMTCIQIMSLVITILLQVGYSYAYSVGSSLQIRIDAENTNHRLTYQGGPFANIPRLLADAESEAKLKAGTYSQLCAKGAWILYDSPRFALKNYGSLEGIYLYASTELKCTALADIGPFGSVRPLTLFSFQDAHISIFSSKNFQGTQYIVAKKPVAGGAPFIDKPSYSPTMGSVIVVGKYRWTLTLDDGSKVCMQPKKSENSVCILSNIVDNVTFRAEPGVHLIRAHCLINSSRTIELNDCYDFGTGVIRPENPSWPFGGASNASGNGTQKGCDLDISKEVLTPEQQILIRGRINGSIGHGAWLDSVKDQRNAWRTELFDTCLQIFWIVCGRHTVPNEYLVLAASLYYHYWDEAMAKINNNEDIQFTEEEWMELTHNLQECESGLITSGFSAFPDPSFNLFHTYRDLKEIIDPVDKKLGFRREYDHIMEINWIMANTAASVCHSSYRGKLNFITKFWNIYHPLFFAPIKDQWKNPGNASQIYNHIFSGYILEKELAKMMYCAQSTMRTGHWLEPYKRPIEQVEDVFEPRSKGKGEKAVMSESAAVTDGSNQGGAEGA